MKKIVFIIFFSLMMILPTYANSGVNEAISPWNYQSMLGKGIDVDWAKTEKGINYYSEKEVKDFKDIGIKHVRIRVSKNATKEMLNHLELVVNDCLNNDMIPIIAYQADDFKNNPTQENMDKVTDWWKKVAERFEGYSYKLSYDLLIECTDTLNKQPDTLNEMYEQTTTAIRSIDNKRIIIISPIVRSSPENLQYLKIPTLHNNYLMAEWHFYAAGPSKINENKKCTTGTDEEKKLISDRIQIALDWQNSNNIPTWVGAWMPSNYNDENDYTVGEQITFSNYMTKSLEKAKIPFAVNADHQFYDSEKNKWINEKFPVISSIFNTGITIGDADRDGVLSNEDSALILQKVINGNVNLPIEDIPNGLTLLEVDKDGVLSSNDATYVLQKVLDKKFNMPIEK